MDIIYDIEQLSQKSEPLILFDDNGVIEEAKTECLDIIKQLNETLTANPQILAIAAPQIGIKKRIFCVRFDDIIKAFINPILTRKTGQTVLPETCVNLPGKEYIISRPAEVTAVYYTDGFNYEENKFLAPAATVFDQMINVLDGRLPNTDYIGLETDVAEDGSWSEATDEELKAAQDFYLNTYVPRLKATLEANISKDKEADRAYRVEKLTEDVINNRTQIVDEEETKRAISEYKAINRAKKEANKAAFKAFAGKRHK